MKYLLAALIISSIFSCNNAGNENVKIGVINDSPAVVTNDATIATERAVISKKPIASFYKKVPDELNDWHFTVEVYETKETFHYLMKMQYKELLAGDTLKIPNFGIEQK